MDFSGFTEGDDVPPIEEMTEVQRLFYWPNLSKKSYRKTSEWSLNYNCVSWAVGLTSRRIDSGGYSYEWPSNLPKDHSLKAYIKLFELYGFVVCDNWDLEVDKEKIALFEDEFGLFKHVARQLDSGLWSSKMGDLEDIEHHTLDNVNGWFYGNATIIMCRKKKVRIDTP